MPEYSESESLPQPLRELQEQILLLSDVSKLRTIIAENVAALLLNSGADEIMTRESVASLEKELKSGPCDHKAVCAQVKALYQRLIPSTLSTHNPNTTLIVPRTLKDSVDIRIAVRALQSSTAYPTLQKEKIWTLGVNDLRERLTKTICFGDSNWYTIIARIIRYLDKHRDEKGMIGTGIISVEALRGFLCDFVFCVPRGKPVRKKYIPGE